MSDLQDLRESLLKNDLDTIKLILEDRPAGSVKQRHLQLLKVLLEAGANTEILNDDETGPVEEAIDNKDEECLSILLEYGANVNHVANEKNTLWTATPLHLVCNRGTERSLKMLLENRADPNARDEHGKTPLHIAVREGNAVFVQILLNYGARVDIVDDYGGTPLHEVNTLDCATLLVDHGADVTVLTKCGKTVLFSPSDEYGEGSCVQFLIDQGVDPLKEDESGTSAFDLAISRPYCNWSDRNDDAGIGSVKVLMQHGAKLKKTDLTIDRAIRMRRLGLALALLQSGSDINAVGLHGFTALSWAAKAYFPEGVKMLLKEGADPHIKCNDMSPLHIALQNGM